MCSQAFIGMRRAGEIATIEQPVCVLVQRSGIGCRRGLNASKGAVAGLVTLAAAARTRVVARRRRCGHLTSQFRLLGTRRSRERNPYGRELAGFDFPMLPAAGYRGRG